MARRNKKLLAVPIVLSITVIAAGVVLIYKGMVQKKEVPETVSTEISSEEREGKAGEIVWQGKKYQYNEHLSNFLFMGIDKKTKAETSQGQADAGQADAVFLLSWDRVSHDLNLITIPRDTMTEIETFDVSGNSLGKSEDHLSLAYAYGDGGNKSCELMKEAVSNLFYGLSIQGYCAINMDAIPILSEGVGGVTVTVPDDSLEKAYPEFKEGTQVVLDKNNTETFVRYRDTSESQSALKRSERQQVFLDAYAEKAALEFQKDAGFVTDLYNDLQPYMVTNMGNDLFVKIMQDAVSGSEQTKWSLPGEGTEGVSFDEFHVDDNKLYEMILQVFYEESE